MGTDETPQPKVRINGVLYVPVSEASPNAAAIEDALIEQWWGQGWRASAPDAPSYLRVVVGDSFEQDEGQSIEEFVASVAAHIDSSEIV